MVPYPFSALGCFHPRLTAVLLIALPQQLRNWEKIIEKLRLASRIADSAPIIKGGGRVLTHLTLSCEVYI